jgi:hypothetical protein
VPRIKKIVRKQRASLLNKEDKVQADSQVKKLLALANIPTSKMVTTLKQLMTFFFYKIPKRENLNFLT